MLNLPFHKISWAIMFVWVTITLTANGQEKFAPVPSAVAELKEVPATVSPKSVPETPSPLSRKTVPPQVIRTEPDLTTVLSFRYWMVPANKIEEWPWGNNKYYPIKAEIFDKWIDEFEKKDSESNSPVPVNRIRNLRMTARFDGESLVDGTGMFALSIADRDHVPLFMQNIAPACGNFQWSNKKSADVSLFPNRFLSVYPPLEDCLTFQWSMNGIRDRQGNIIFNLDLASTPMAELELTVPVDFIPKCSVGLVREIATQGGDSKKWLFHFGGHQSPCITLVPVGLNTNIQQKTGYQQEMEYDVSLEGISVSCRFLFARPETPIDDLTLVFDKPLIPVSIEWESDRSVPVITTKSSNTDSIKLVMPFANSQEGAVTLRIKAFMPIKRNFTGKLSRIRVFSEKLLWKETQCRLTVAQPLLATGFVTSQAASAFDPTRSGKDFESSYLFKYFGVDGSVSLSCTELKTRVRFDSETDTLFMPEEINAVTNLKLRLEGPECSRIELPLSDGWEIDTVTSESGEDIFWEYSEPRADHKRTILVSMKKRKALTSAFPLQIVGRLTRTVEDSIPIDSLSPVDLSDVLTGDHYLLIHCELPYQIRIKNWDGTQYDTTTQSAGDLSVRERFRDTGTGFLVSLGNGSRGVTASLEKKTPDYSSTIQGSVVVEKDFLMEKWRIRCIPATGSRVDRVLVAMTEPAETDSGINSESYHSTAWRGQLSGEDERAFQSILLSEREKQQLGIPNSIEVREIRLQTSRSVPFELEFMRSTRMDSLVRTSRQKEEEKTPMIPPEEDESAVKALNLPVPYQIPLVFLPEIREQTAELQIESPMSLPVKIESSGMEQVPVVLTGINEQETLRGCYRYNPRKLRDHVHDLFNADSSSNTTGETSNDHEIHHQNNRIDLTLCLLPNTNVLGEESSRAPAWCWFFRCDSQHDSKGTVRNHLCYNIENRGRQSCTFKLPEGVETTAVYAVWIDGRRVTWYPGHEDDLATIRVMFPPRQRYLTIFLEYSVTEEPLDKNGTVRPKLPQPDFPVLTGQWGLWLPPEWKAKSLFDTETRERESILAEILAAKRFKAIRESAGYLVRQLSNEELFKQLLSSRFRKEKEEPAIDVTLPSPVSGEKKADPVIRSGNVLTWGDLLTDPYFSSHLFAETQTRGLPTIYIDRGALSRSGIVPSSPVLWREAHSPEGKALGTLDNAEIVFIMIDSSTIYVTDVAYSICNRQSLESLYGDRVWCFREKLVADQLLASFTDNSDVVPAFFWKADNVGSIGPWIGFHRGSKLLSETPRWNTYEFPLSVAEKGVEVVNRYWLVVQKWFFFLLVPGLTVRAPGKNAWTPAILILLTAASGAFALYVSAPNAYLLRGIFDGAILSLVIWFIRCCALSSSGLLTPPPLLDQKEPTPSENGSSMPGFLPLEKDRSDPSASQEKSAMLDTADPSTFVTLPETPADSLPQSPQRILEGNQNREEGRGNNSHGSTLTSFLFLLVLVMGIMATALTVFAAVPVADNLDDSSNNRSIPSGSIEETSPVSTQTETPAVPANSDKRVEPYRVFVPVDAEQKPLKNYYYWIPEEFYRKLRGVIQQEQNAGKQWSITQARYSGAVNYNITTGTLSMFHLRATYRIRLEANQATIILPMMPILPDGGAKFDKQPIVPIYDRPNRDGQTQITDEPLDSLSKFDGELVAEQTNDSGSLIFEITNTTPGEHTLELSLTMPQFGSDQNVSIGIPPVPDSFLELSVPPEAPRIKVLGARGSVTIAGGRINAALGATDRLALAKSNETGNGGGTMIDVEQLFRIHARVNQTDLHSRFIYRISGGKVKSLCLQNDPRYVFSGQCSCEEAEIESVERDDANDMVRIIFKRPVAGTLALSANYVVEGFSGVGQIRLPRIKAADARITRNWIGLSESSAVQYVNLPPSDISVGLFRTAWGESDGVNILAAYDLLRPNPGRLLSIQLKSEPVKVSWQQTLTFHPKTVEIDYYAELDGLNNFLRCSLKTDPRFVLRTVMVLDENKSPIESPEYFQAGGRLFLFFRNPLIGKHSICLSGRTQSYMEKEFNIPLLKLDGIPTSASRVRIYRSPSVYLDLSKPILRTVAGGARIEEQPTQYQTRPTGLFVGDYFPGAPEQTPMTASELRVTIHQNLPQITGTQQGVLFQQAGQNWELGIRFALNITRGEINSLDLELDELCTGPVRIEPASEWRVLSGDRKRVVRLQSTGMLRGPVVFFLYIPVSGNVESLRIPRVSLVDINSKKPAILLNDSPLVVRPRTPEKDADNSQANHMTTIAIRTSLEKTVLLPLREKNNLRGLQWEVNGMIHKASPQPAPGSSGTKPKATAASDNYDESAFMETVTRLSGMTRTDFVEYRTIREDASASVVVGQNTPVVTGAEYTFRIRANGTLDGVAVMDLRVAGQKECFLILPGHCRLLQVTVDGIGQSVLPDSRNRYRIELVPQLFSQRIEITFYSHNDPNEKSKSGNILSLAHKKYDYHGIYLPRLENIHIEKMYWICSIDYDTLPGTANVNPCLVRQLSLQDSNRPPAYPRAMDRPPIEPKAMIQSNWKIPISSNAIGPVLLSLNYEKMSHLLNVFQTTAGSLGQSENDLNRWYARWLIRWWTCRNETESILLPEKDTLPFGYAQKTAIFQKVQEQTTDTMDPSAVEQNDNTSADSLSRIHAISSKEFRALYDTHDKLVQTYQLQSVRETLLPRRRTVQSPLTLWRMNHSVHARYLFGYTNEDTERIDFFLPRRERFVAPAILGKTFLWLAAAVVALTLLRKERYHERLKNNVHIWGTAIGLLWFVVGSPLFYGWVFIALAIWAKWYRVTHPTPPTFIEPPVEK